MINRLAASTLPADVPAFLRSAAAMDKLNTWSRARPLAFAGRTRTGGRPGPGTLYRP